MKVPHDKDRIGGGKEPRPMTSHANGKWDYGSHEEFYQYYATESTSPEAVHRFRSIRDTVMRLNPRLADLRPCEVADIGCGAGTQSMIWAELGCKVHGIDVNKPLLELARQRAAKAGSGIDFVLGSAVSLPWPNEYVDVCLAVELLEHVGDWESCLKEASRIVRPGGVLFLSTTNVLCPIQEEFNLPLYSWYPGAVKRYCEKLAKTTRPQLANYAKYPAENWFTFYQLRDFLKFQGFQSLDRFDAVDVSRKGPFARKVLRSIRAVPFVRWLAHVATPGTTLIAIKGR
jgi:2-polyprenyl-3-methyl-5-hydroxy-6-metoxy-1,4-benzoquinol methylase